MRIQLQKPVDARRLHEALQGLDVAMVANGDDPLLIVSLITQDPDGVYDALRTADNDSHKDEAHVESRPQMRKAIILSPSDLKKSGSRFEPLSKGRPIDSDLVPEKRTIHRKDGHPYQAIRWVSPHKDEPQAEKPKPQEDDRINRIREAVATRNYMKDDISPELLQDVKEAYGEKLKLFGVDPDSLRIGKTVMGSTAIVADMNEKPAKYLAHLLKWAPEKMETAVLEDMFGMPTLFAQTGSASRTLQLMPSSTSASNQRLEIDLKPGHGHELAKTPARKKHPWNDKRYETRWDMSQEEEAADYYNQLMFDIYAPHMTKDEHFAIEAYTSQNYKDINRTMREDFTGEATESDWSHMIHLDYMPQRHMSIERIRDNMMQMMSKSPGLLKSQKLYRGMSEIPDGLARQGVTNIEEASEFFRKHKGWALYDPGFTSTSICMDKAKSFADTDSEPLSLIFRVDAPKGTAAQWMEGSQEFGPVKPSTVNEEEVLLPPGTMMVIKGARRHKREGGVNLYVDCEIIPMDIDELYDLNGRVKEAFQREDEERSGPGITGRVRELEEKQMTERRHHYEDYSIDIEDAARKIAGEAVPDDIELQPGSELDVSKIRDLIYLETSREHWRPIRDIRWPIEALATSEPPTFTEEQAGRIADLVENGYKTRIEPIMDKRRQGDTAMEKRHEKELKDFKSKHVVKPTYVHRDRPVLALSLSNSLRKSSIPQIPVGSSPSKTHAPKPTGPENNDRFLVGNGELYVYNPQTALKGMSLKKTTHASLAEMAVQLGLAHEAANILMGKPKIPLFGLKRK